MWSVTIKTENDNSFEFKIQPNAPIGSLVLNLVSHLPETENWSEYTLFFEEKNIWLNNPRHSLEQAELYNGVFLRFIKTNIPAYIILPNFRLIRLTIDTCAQVIDILKMVCESLGLRRFEELSFMIIPGKESDLNPAKTGKDARKNEEKNTDFYSIIETYYNSTEKCNKTPIYEFNIKIPEFVYWMLPKTNSFSDWCSLHEKWTIFNKSLKNQGFKNEDVLYLRFKYTQFSDFNPKVEDVRFKFIYAQAVHSLQCQELKCDDIELFDMVAMVWHDQLIIDKEFKEESVNEQFEVIDDVDMALKRLEMSAKASDSEKPGEGLMNEIIDIKSILPNQRAKDAKLTTLLRTWLTVYKGTTESEKYIMASTSLIGATITPKLDFQKNTYKIKLTNILDKKSKPIKLDLHFEDQTDFINWWACIRCASRGNSTKGIKLEQEKIYLRSYLRMKRKLANNSDPALKTTWGIENLFPPWIYKNPKYSQENVLEVLLDYFPSYCDLGQKDLRLNFFNKWKGLTYCNIILFKVVFDPVFEKNQNNKKFDLLGINSRFILRINPASEEIIEKWSCFNIKNWNINWRSNTQVVNLEQTKITVFSVNCEIKKIHECIGGNIYHNSRSDPLLPFDLSMFTKLAS